MLAEWILYEAFKPAEHIVQIFCFKQVAKSSLRETLGISCYVTQEILLPGQQISFPPHQLRLEASCLLLNVFGKHMIAKILDLFSLS